MHRPIAASLLFFAACLPSGQSSEPAAAPPPPSAPKSLALEIPPAPKSADPEPLIQIMETELQRQMAGLKAKGTPPPYFIGHEVTDQDYLTITADHGSLLSSRRSRGRTLDVEVRVGAPELDNSHPIRGGRRGRHDPGRGVSRALPFDDDPQALAAGMWLATEDAYRDAVERYGAVKANRAVKVAEEDSSADFSQEKPVVHLEQTVRQEVDAAPWEQRLRTLSATFDTFPRLVESSVSFSAAVTNRYLVTSEGSRVQSGRTHVRLSFSVTSKAEDGMTLSLSDHFDAAAPEGLPDDATITARIQEVAGLVVAMADAPLAEPYAGPAILEGRAAGVFFHETFGHRVEGHRQKSEAEGQTFTKKIGEQIMPKTIDVYDDPTVASVNGIELNGHYRLDNEGVAAQRAMLVDDGVMRGFLMSRSPIRGFASSNGHGRRQPGRRVVARQGNLIIDPATVVTRPQLTEALLAEVKRQGKPYGLRFIEVSGGYTTTQRAGPQAFKVNPRVVYRVYPDGREELIRGVDLEGTPLTALSKILAAANDFAVFNGYCGAESGQVPVSAVSPSLLLAQVEVARKKKSQTRPPILPPPSAQGGE